MPVVPTYPGIYIDEILSSAHTIEAAPTSIAVFVGYTHPFKTLQFAEHKDLNTTTPVRLFSFNDYEREFGGFIPGIAFADPGRAFADDRPGADFGSVAFAVYQFFLNGGAVCYVVGLRPHAKSVTGPIVQQRAPVRGVTFAQIEITEELTDPPTVDPDGKHRTNMAITVDNVRPDPRSSFPSLTIADVTIAYGAGAGAVFEKFRGVDLREKIANPADPAHAKDNPNYILTRIGTSPRSGSTLVNVVADSTTPLPAAFTDDPGAGAKPVLPVYMPATALTGGVRLDERDFTDATVGAFASNGALDKLAIFNLMNLPGVTDNGALSAAVAFCERKLAFLLIDPPRDRAADDRGGPGTKAIEAFIDSPGSVPFEKNAALYFPYLQATDPVTGANVHIPPCGTVAGIMARIDTSRGVWKAPAGYEATVVNTLGVVPQGRMTNEQQGVLNGLGVNCLRDFPGVGTVVFGARTLVTQNPSLSHDWRYVPVRRMALFLEQTLLNNLGWVVFEPNDVPLWTAIRTTIESFMLGLFRQGALQGTKPSDAFQVKCDNTTTTPEDVVRGVVNIVVAFAPLRPAEFVVVKITQLAGQAQAAA